MDWCVLWARAVAVGSIAFSLGVAGHVMADGLLPGPLLLGSLLALSVLLSVPMLNRPASRLRLVAMMMGGQTLIHLALSVSAGHTGDRPAPAAGHTAATGLRTLPVVDGHRLGSLQDAYQGMSGQPSSMAPTLPVGHLINDMSAHAPMMVAHLAAAALVGLWLAYGERCLWTLIALAGRRILSRTWTLVPHGPRVSRVNPGHDVPTLRAPQWQVAGSPLRGPPALSC